MQTIEEAQTKVKAEIIDALRTIWEWDERETSAPTLFDSEVLGDEAIEVDIAWGFMPKVAAVHLWVERDDAWAKLPAEEVAVLAAAAGWAQ